MNFLRKLFCFAIPLCPICGMLLEKEKFQCKDKVIDIWYCKNSNHENTAPNGIKVEQISFNLVYAKK